MAMQTKTNGLSIDVAKDWLDIFNGDTVERVENTQKAILAYLKLLPTSVPMAIKATNVFHELFVRLALRQTIWCIWSMRVEWPIIEKPLVSELKQMVLMRGFYIPI